MPDDDPQNDFDLGSIQEPGGEPPADADALTLEEELSLTPSKRVLYDQKQLVSRLDSQIDRVRDERDHEKVHVERLRDVERDYIRLDELHKQARWSTGVVVVSMTIGSGLISSYAGSWPVGFSLGWSLVVFPSVLQLGKSVFNIKF